MNSMSDIRKPPRLAVSGEARLGGPARTTERIIRSGGGKSIERALGALQGQYVIVPRGRVRSWRFWLAAGLIVGIIVALVVIARRSARDSEEATDEPFLFNLIEEHNTFAHSHPNSRYDGIMKKGAEVSAPFA